MSHIDSSDSDQYVELEEGDEETGAPSPDAPSRPADKDADLDDEGDDLGAFAQADSSDFSGLEVGPAGGVEGDFNDDADEDEIGAGDLGEGVEDYEDDENATPSTERRLDKGLKETFPASDPVSINPGAD